MTDPMNRSCSKRDPFTPTIVKPVDGFFTPKTSIPPNALCPALAFPLFARFEMVPKSWTDLRRKLMQLQTEKRLNGAYRQIKVVYFLRHAEGTHNEAHAKYGSPRWEDEFARTSAFLDAPLTPFGVKDAQSKGPASVQVELDQGMPRIERVVVSPISRAIQTAQHFFTTEQVPGDPFTCIESCRETLDRHTCNKRRLRSELELRFPTVDFSRLKSEDDQLWSSTYRETLEEIQTRAREFLLELFREVPEHYVVVAAHLSIIEAICAVTLGIEIRPRNCEIIPIVLEAL